MRTSRRAIDTRKFTLATATARSSVAPPPPPPRNTRSFARSLRAYAASNGSTADGNRTTNDNARAGIRTTQDPPIPTGAPHDGHTATSSKTSVKLESPSDSELSSIPTQSDIDLSDGDAPSHAEEILGTSAELTPVSRTKRKREVVEYEIETPKVAASTPQAPKVARYSAIKVEQEHEPSRYGATKVRRKRKSRKKDDDDDGVGSHLDEHGEVLPPPRWRETYDTMKAMRSKIVAPVDTMGCERLADVTMSERDQRFQTLIALMLSSQTKDTVTAVAMKKLQASLPPPGFNLEGMLNVPAAKLNELIHAVGFHNTKTKHIKATAEMLRDRFDGDIPADPAGLMSLPGVGPKMAYLCMSAAWGRTEGIGVDVHVHRITNLWGWHNYHHEHRHRAHQTGSGSAGFTRNEDERWQRPPKPSKNPEETRLSLQAWLPRELWHEINHLLVGFGQTVCLPVGRKCGECDVGAKGLCPGMLRSSGGRSVTIKKATVRKQMKGAGSVQRLVKKEEVVEEDPAEEKVEGMGDVVGDIVGDIQGGEAKVVVRDVEDLL